MNIFDRPNHSRNAQDMSDQSLGAIMVGQFWVGDTKPDQIQNFYKSFKK